MKVTNIVNIDLSIRQNIPFVDAVQGDSARAIEFRLFDKGQPFKVPDGSSVLIRYKRPDGFGGVYDTLPNGEPAYSINANKVTAVLSPTALGVAGNVDFQVTVSNGEYLISAFALEIRVDADPSADVVDAEDYINISQFVTEESKKNAPYIGDNGNWWVNQEDTGVKAGGGSGGGGADGFSPVANVTQTETGAVITITDKSGTTTATIVNGVDGKDGADGQNGKDGYTPQKGIDYFDGANGSDGKDGSNGKDGVPATHSWNGTTLTITSASGTSSANLKGDTGSAGKDGTSVTVKSVRESTADGGSNVVTFSDGKTLTVKNGSKGSTGATGQRGTGMLPVTTAPTGYTTEVNGLTPSYRIALSTVKTQASTAEVFVGDTVLHSYNCYPVIYVDSSYVYFGARVSIRGSAGKDGTTPVKGTDYFTEADKAEMVDDVVAEMQAAVIEPADGDIPKVFLTGSEFSNMTTDKNEVNMEMEYRSKTKQFHAYIGIKYQGTSSLDYDKKNFTVKLFDDEAHASKQTHLFRDWKYAKNKFVLKANFIDHSHARNIVCANLWDEVVSSRSDYSSLPEELRNSPKNGAVDGFPIKLYVNGTYQGIYTWNIGKDDWTWGMDEDNANHILLCVENNSDGVYKERPYNFRALWDGASAYFEVEIGTKDTAKNPINNLISFVMNNNGTAFRNGIGAYLDVQSAIDYYIHQYVICGLDGLAKNMLLGTYDGKKWYCNAYDMDSTLGLYWNGKSFVSPTYKCPEDYCEPFNLLWERLESNFWSEIKTRYAQLRNTVYSVGNIFTHFEQFMDTIGLDLYAEDLEIFTSIPNGSANNIKQLRNFIRDRLTYCDAKIANGVPATAVTLNKTTLEINTIGSTVTLTATATPSNHTDEVMWLSSNDSIATVTNGVVKAVADGECEIRAKCGSGYAVCSVKVSTVVLPTYTNQVPISTDENGNVYNGTGYKDGYRIRSNGEEQSFKSTCTGFIPAKAGDVVRLYCPTDGVFLTTTNNKSSFNVYDASKTMLGQMATDATYGTFGNTSNKWEDITKVNGVFEYTIPSNVGDVAFIRLAVGFPSGIEPTGAGMIVTVNQEITA